MTKNSRLIALTGLATFLFGFAAGACYNLYLIQISDPLVTQFRAALSYKSAILGDGILLPAINMLMVAFLLDQKKYLTQRVKYAGVLGGLGITAYFHIKQALDGIVNWAMPAAWHWNLLGLWHFCYMLSVATLISVFYLVAIKVAQKDQTKIKELLIVSVGILLFLFILRLDYIDIRLW